MPAMTAIWTALPNGLTGDPANRRARLSVYISMRLTTDTGEDGTLAAFPAALSWPSLLQPTAVTISVQGAGGSSVTAKVVSPPPELVLWQDLFSSTTRVVSHQPDDLTARPINTYPAAALHDHLRTGHQRLSVGSSVVLPTRQQLRDALPELHEAFAPGEPLPEAPPAGAASRGDLERFHRSIARNLFRRSIGSDIHRNMAQLVSTARRLAAASAPETLVTVVPDDGTPDSHFKALYAFHHRESADPSNPPAPLPSVDAGSVLDFHQALAALAQYPELLRRLGLVLDLEIPEANLPQSPLSGGAGRVQVSPLFNSEVSFRNFTPATAYILDGDQIFTPTPQDPSQPETIAGLLNLALPDEFALVQIDVDGLGLKALNMVASNTLQLAANSGADDSEGMPAPRAPGIAVTRSGHASVLAQRFAAASQNNKQLGADPPQAVTLFAEDVTRGFRFDIFDAQSGWHSLHSRNGSYVFLNHPDGPLTLTIADEGASQLAATHRVDGTADVQAQLYIHESLMQWKGWSLAVPHPGKAISKTGPATITSHAISGGFPLEVNFTRVAGTLPRLRFHQHYQVRARAVDLAGNSISLTEANGVLDLLPTLGRPAPILPSNLADFTMRRFEPVLAPHLVARERFSEGESVARMVIRSNAGETAGACAVRLMALVAARRPLAPVIYTAANDRHVLPPKTSQFTAETHGLFDASFGTGGGFQSTYNVARKEKGRLTDTAIIDTATGNSVPIPDTTGIDPLTGNTINRAAVEFIVTADDINGPNGYAVHHEPQLTLPYLPDPLSRGATLCGIPGVPPGESGVLDAQGKLTFVQSTLPPQNIAALVSTTQIDFGTDWPERLPFRLQLAEPTDPDGATEPPSWDPQNRILALRLAKSEQATVRLSSFLQTTDLDALGIWQWMLERNAAQGDPPPDAGDAETAVAGCMWMLTPFLEINVVHAVQQPLLEPEFQSAIPGTESVITPRDPSATFAYFGATAKVHGKSTAKLDLLASWQESVDRPDDLAPTTQTVNAHVFEVLIHLPADGPTSTGQDGTVPIATYDASSDVMTFQVKPDGDPRTFLSRHEFGDTKYRRVSYKLVATTRFREYFPREIEDVSLSGKAVTVDVPSTGRPAAPDIAYAVPLFEWSSGPTAAGGTMRTRTGGGVRVYLKRPWYSSGDGEMLGVVLADPADYPPDDRLRPFVTHWGNDPIWQTGSVADYPQDAGFKKLFPRAALTKAFLVLDEVSAAEHRVFVAGHTLELGDFDSDRKLWVCDIQIKIDSGQSYNPFVRLALARYQPHSLEGLEVSRVVLTDFVQLAPDRTVTINPVEGDPNSFAISVQGLTYQRSAWDPSLPISDLDPQSEQIATPLQELMTMTPPELIQVTVEQRIPGTQDEAGWEPASDIAATAVRIDSAVSADFPRGTPPSLWSGQVTLPPDRQSGQFRVVVREYERLPTDERLVETARVHVDPDPAVKGDHGHFENRTLTFRPGSPAAPTPKPGRMVFAETIEL
jgi:hypothetical protein